MLCVFAVLLLLVLVLLVASIAYVNSSWKDDHDHRRHDLPPGLRKGWSSIVIENLSFYRSKQSVHHFLKPRVARYGKIFTTHLFGKKAVMSVDGHFNKWVLQNEGKLFKAKFPASFSRVIGKYSFLSVHGDHHKKIHNMALRLLSPDKLKIHFLAEIETLVRARIGSWIGNEIRLQNECRAMVLELMLKVLLDIDFRSEGATICREFHDFTSSGISFPIRLPGTNFYRALKAREALVGRVKKEIEERKHNSNKVERGDVLTKLLIQEEEEEEGDQLSEEAIIDFILFVAFGGYSSPSRNMTYAVKYLTENPTAFQQLKEEQDEIAEKNRGDHKLTWEDYKSMKFTQCVIYETLRLRGANFLSRETITDISVNDGKYIIPKGMALFLVNDGVHQDPANYDSPFDFNPWRWQGRSINEAIFLSFGGGPRLCPGAQLAKLEIAIFLHVLVTTCRWEVTKEDSSVQFPTPHLIHGYPMHVYRKDD